MASGGLLAPAWPSKANALGYTLTDINVPGANVVLSIDNLGQVAGSYGIPCSCCLRRRFL
jgi:hypothetical protein